MRINRPDFILLPCVIIDNPNINPIDRCVYGFIYWYSRMEAKKCIVSNDTLADLCNTTPRVIQASLDRLETERYIHRIYSDETRRTRKEIIPLIVIEVRLTDGTVRPTDDTSTTHKSLKVRPTDDQNKNILIRIDNKNTNSSNWLKTVINIYSSFWKETYGEDKQVFNWGRLGKTLAPLKNLSEQQWRLLIKLHFNWRGASGDDEKAFKYMADKFFPLEWIPHNFDGYKAYVVNHLGLDWNNDEQLKEYNK